MYSLLLMLCCFIILWKDIKVNGFISSLPESAHKVLRKRTRGRRTEYLVQWKGYRFDEATWEHHENLVDRDGTETEALKEFLRRGEEGAPNKKRRK